MVTDRPDLRSRLLDRAGAGDVSVVRQGEGLGRLRSPTLRVVVLDLGDSRGMELLRRVSDTRPDVRLLALDYPASPEEIVEAARLGVERFLPSTVSPSELREAIEAEPESDRLRAERYQARIARARESLREHQVHVAAAHARRALAIDPSRPEAYNLLGVAQEATVHRAEALKYYRMALAADPSYELAQRNASTAAKPVTERGPAEFE